MSYPKPIVLLLLTILSVQGQGQTVSKASTDSVATAQRNWVAKTTANAIKARRGKSFRKAPAGFALYFLRVDTLQVPYWVYVPKHYNPTKAHQTIVYLHGGVVSTTDFAYQDSDYSTESIFAIAEAHNALVLYPFARKSFGWVNQLASFEYVLTMLRTAKQHYNIDDKQVVLGGMSNGGSATFWFASHHPELFAGFYTFSAWPVLQVGAVDYNALSIKPFYSLHALDDSLYRYQKVKAIYDLHKGQASAWHLDTVARGGHGFIYRSNGEAEMKKVLDKLLK